MGREDFQLWKAFTRDIEAWRDLEEEEGPADDGLSDTPDSGAYAPSAQVPDKKGSLVRISISSPSQPAQLDARTEARLRRGQMPIEGRIDLHGCTQDEAHRRLNAFLGRAHADGKRCVLVITGKGGSRSTDGDSPIGVLRSKLPLWITLPPLAPIVLKALPAALKDGGSGAWYIYLKRNR